MRSCQQLRPAGSHAGKQGFSHFEGIARETTGARGICGHLLTVPPGGLARAHEHAARETAICMTEGVTAMHWGARLEHRMEAAGDPICSPADMPRLPLNPGPASAAVARTGPHGQESVVPLPELEALVP